MISDGENVSAQVEIVNKIVKVLSAEGHIPRTINIANETIGAEAPAELPDKNQIIYVYCRSGNRSKQAAEKLAALGYTNIIEFGGIIDWTGDVEK